MAGVAAVKKVGKNMKKFKMAVKLNYPKSPKRQVNFHEEKKKKKRNGQMFKMGSKRISISFFSGLFSVRRVNSSLFQSDKFIIVIWMIQ